MTSPEVALCVAMTGWVVIEVCNMHGTDKVFPDLATLAILMVAVIVSTPMVKASPLYRPSVQSGLLLGCCTVPVVMAAVMLRTRGKADIAAFYMRLAVACSAVFAFEGVWSDGRWGGDLTEGGRRAARRNLMRPTLVALLMGATLAARFRWLPTLVPVATLVGGQLLMRALMRGVRGGFTLAEGIVVASGLTLLCLDTAATAAGMLSKKMRTPLARRIDKVDIAVQCLLVGTVVVAIALWPFVAGAASAERKKKEDEGKEPDDTEVKETPKDKKGDDKKQAPTTGEETAAALEKCEECGGEVGREGDGACSCIGRGVSAKREKAKKEDAWRETKFLTVLAAVVGLVCMPAASLLLKKHFLVFIADHLSAEPQRLTILAYWAGVVILVLGTYPPKNSTLPRTVVRKGYHLVALLLFAPAQLLQPETMRLSYAIAMALFVTLELFRAARIGPISAILRRGMAKVVDERDTGVLVLTHIYLLLGCALPSWLIQGGPLKSGLRPLLPFAGILVVGVGDTAAAIVGTYWGKTRWSRVKPGGSEAVPGGRTVEGTVAGVVATFLACIGVLFLASPGDKVLGVLLSPAGLALLGACGAMCLLEAFTDQIDNLVLPIWFFSLLVAAGRA